MIVVIVVSMYITPYRTPTYYSRILPIQGFIEGIRSMSRVLFRSRGSGTPVGLEFI